MLSGINNVEFSHIQSCLAINSEIFMFLIYIVA